MTTRRQARRVGGDSPPALPTAVRQPGVRLGPRGGTGQGRARALSSLVGRWLLIRFQRNGVALAKLPMVPRSLRFPLRRDGLDPVAEMARTRAAEPVSKLARLFGMNIWMVSGYHELQAVLADTTNYSNDIRPFVGNDSSSPENQVGGLGFTDPPDHTRLRKILTPEFTMRRLERLKPRIAEIVEHQLDVVEAAGPEVDLVENFAFPIPFLVICELLGLPDEDQAEFMRLGPARFDVTQGGIGVFDAASESRTFLLEAARRQRKNPGDGLIGRIIQDHGDLVDDVELGGLADGVFLGGYETTASMLALGTLVLVQHPDTFAVVREGGPDVDRVVDELLRYLSVVQLGFPRFAKRDLELFGRRISAGDVLLCSLSGANRDARLGDDMDVFDPTRPPVSHLSFGHGFHRCVGAELARMELRTAYPALARRFPHLSLAVPPSDLRFRDLSIVYGVEALPVRLGSR
jgi:cytochrome P450